MDELRVTGVLSVLADGRGPVGYGRRAVDGGVAGHESVYVQPGLIRRFCLRTGDQLSGLVRPPLNRVHEWHLFHLEHITGDDAEAVRRQRLQALQASDML